MVDGDLLGRDRALARARACSARSSRAQLLRRARRRSTPSRSRSRSRTSFARSSRTPRSRPPSCPSSASCSRRASRRGPGASPRPSSGSSCSSSGGLTALFILAAPVLMPPLTDAYDDLAVTLSQILFPIVVLIGLFGIVTGILNSYDEFTIPALTPVFWNLAIIVGLVIGAACADTRERQALRVCRLDRRRDGDPVPAAAALAARARRPAPARARRPRPGGASRSSS